MPSLPGYGISQVRSGGPVLMHHLKQPQWLMSGRRQSIVLDINTAYKEVILDSFVRRIVNGFFVNSDRTGFIGLCNTTTEK